jgi:penicillin-binding protein 2
MTDRRARSAGTPAWPTASSAHGEDEQARFTRRAILLGVANAAVFGGLTARLYDLQVLNGAQLAAVADDNRSRTIWLPARRGRIRDAAGELLAESGETYRIVLYPQRGLTPAAAKRIVADLASRLGVPPDPLEALVLRSSERARTAPVVLAEPLTFEQVAALHVSTLEASNVIVEPTWQRVYRALPLAVEEAVAHIVGHVGAVERFAIDDDPQLRQRGARIGKSGIEAGMEADLRGVAGRTVYEIDARGRHVRRLDERPPSAGRDVTLTIDLRLQQAVCARLKAAREPGAVVVLDAPNGAVLAMGSSPSFNAAPLREPKATAAWRSARNDPGRPLLNRATSGQYPPGSTFKIVTALAALEAELVTTKEKIECWGDVNYAGHTFRCWNRRGHIASDLHKAMRESCDCYFYEAARRTGIDRIAAMANELGLGQTFEAGIEPQKAGLIPTPAWKRGRTRTGWLLGETILAGIGQGYVLTTPLQLAVMAARVATGRKVSPTLIARPAGDPPPQFEALAVSQASLDAVRRALVAVVNDAGGTGHAADPDDGKTIVAGKTGTSQVSRASADRDSKATLKRTQRDHAVFVAYAPAEAPRYAIATVLEHAGSGGSEAGPLVRDVVKALIDHDAAVTAAAGGAAGRATGQSG